MMRKRLFRKPVACGLFALFLAMTATSVVAAAAEGPGASLVVTAKVVQREVAEGKTFVGTVLPSRRSVIGSAVEGRVLDLVVDDGDWVETGATLAELRTVTIKLELDAAKAELELRKHELEELKYSLPVEREQAQAALARTKALREYAKSRLVRAEALFAKGVATSLEELEQIRSAATAAEQSAVEATATYQLMLRPRDEKILQAEAQVGKQEAEVARLEDQLEKYTVRAPFDGYVTAKHTEDGAWIKQGEPVVELVSVDPMEVSVLVPEEFIASLRPGMPASVQLDAVAAQLAGRRNLADRPASGRAVPQLSGQTGHQQPARRFRTCAQVRHVGARDAGRGTAEAGDARSEGCLGPGGTDTPGVCRGQRSPDSPADRLAGPRSIGRRRRGRDASHGQSATRTKRRDPRQRTARAGSARRRGR